MKSNPIDSNPIKVLSVLACVSVCLYLCVCLCVYVCGFVINSVYADTERLTLLILVVTDTVA